ncbi:cyclopropane-fatty-acyl-phospholipid synthase family protein [Pantoea sp. 1.19]|uniref:SAM-dependent methyltransferase n=1 Tax=Pantoea sp. 1.19 TaxID=1925589 RepID=UPI000948D277|nr:cyclopropane-fatty-acyl-phospholipid synthase family protein [Pantoea sp. 1.19]
MCLSDITSSRSVKTRGRLSPARRSVLKLLTHLQAGSLTLHEPDGRVQQFGDPHSTLQAEVIVQHPRAWRRLLTGGSIGAAESYMDGDWSSPDLTQVIVLLARNLPLLDRLEARLSWLTRPLNAVIHALRRNSVRQAKKNIAAHYDLGNDFYRSFLDEALLYSSAWYADPDMTLEAAQQAKMRRLCEQLALTPDDHLLEIGTGWGAMAEFAAREYGCRVTTTTISQQQFLYSQQRIADAGLSDRVTVLCEDYRHLTGVYDKLVSIEMIEAVGKAYIPAFLSRCQTLLKPGGRMAIQAITISDDRYESYARGVDFIQRYIFPGGFLPSPRLLDETLAAHTDFSPVDHFEIGPDYARTLNVWQRRFEQAWPQLRQMGFDERFRRMWCFYLSYCEGGFIARTIGTLQLTAQRPQ